VRARVDLELAAGQMARGATRKHRPRDLSARQQKHGRRRQRRDDGGEQQASASACGTKTLHLIPPLGICTRWLAFEAGEMTRSGQADSSAQVRALTACQTAKSSINSLSLLLIPKKS